MKSQIYARGRLLSLCFSPESGIISRNKVIWPENLEDSGELQRELCRENVQSPLRRKFIGIYDLSNGRCMGTLKKKKCKTTPEID